MKRLIDMMIVLPAAAFALPVLVDSALKGALLMGMVLLATVLLRRSSAALRHLVLAAAMVGLLILPLLSLTLPGWRVLPAWAQTRVAEPMEVGRSSDTGVVIGSDFAGAPVAEIAEGGAVVGATQGDAAAGQERSWVVLAVWAWVLGGALLGLRLLLSRIALWRLGRTAHRCEDGDQLAMLAELKSGLGIRREVDLLVHPDRAMPMTWGIFKTRLLLPLESADWQTGRLRAVLLHELAHVKRRDCLTQLLVQSTCAVHWFNPLVWVAARRVSVERERACDDLVLNSGIRASDYAEHLLRIATGYEDKPVAAAAALAMARKSRLEGRLTNILSARTNRGAITRRVAMAVACGLALLAFPVAMMRAVADEGGGATAEDSIDPAEGQATIVSLHPENGTAVANFGTADGLKVGQELEVLRNRKKIGELIVVDVRKDLCVGIKVRDGEPLKVGDAVRAGRVRAGQGADEKEALAKVQVNNDWGFVIVDRGSDDGVELGTPFVIVRDGKSIGEVKAVSVEKNLSVCEQDQRESKGVVRFKGSDGAYIKKLKGLDPEKPEADLDRALEELDELAEKWASSAEGDERKKGDGEGSIGKRTFFGGAETLRGFDYRAAEPSRYPGGDPLLMPESPKGNHEDPSRPPTYSGSSYRYLYGDPHWNVPVLPRDPKFFESFKLEVPPEWLKLHQAKTESEPTELEKALAPGELTELLPDDSSNTTIFARPVGRNSRVRSQSYPGYGQSLSVPWAEVVGEEEGDDAEGEPKKNEKKDPGGKAATGKLKDPWGNEFTIRYHWKDRPPGITTEFAEGVSDFDAGTKLSLKEWQKSDPEAAERWFSEQESLVDPSKAPPADLFSDSKQSVTGTKFTRIETPAETADRVSKRFPTHPGVQKLSMRRAELKKQKATLKAHGLGETHPRVKMLDAMIVEVERAMGVLSQATWVAEEKDDGGLTAELDQLKASLAHRKATLAELRTKFKEESPTVQAMQRETDELLAELSGKLAERSAQQQNALAKNGFAGIGVMLSQGDDGEFKVMEMLDGAPAQKSGKIEPGDRIVALAEGSAPARGEKRKRREWTETKGMTMAQLVGLLRGKAGDTVHLRLKRVDDGGAVHTHELALVRKQLNLKIPGGGVPADPVPSEPELEPLVAADPRPGVRPVKPQPSGQPVLLQLKRADAAEAKKLIDGMIRESRRGRVLLDAETNSLIYMGDEKTLKLVRSMIEWLDQ